MGGLFPSPLKEADGAASAQTLDAVSVSLGPDGAWGYGPTGKDGLPTLWVRKEVGEVVVAVGLEGAAHLNGLRGVLRGGKQNGRYIVDFGGEHGTKALKPDNLRSDTRSSNVMLAVTPGVVMVHQRGEVLQELPVSHISRVLTVRAEGEHHTLLRAFAGRRSMYLVHSTIPDLPQRLISAGLRAEQYEVVPFWHAGGPSCFAERVKEVAVEYPMKPTAVPVTEWSERARARALALCCQGQLPADCVRCAMGYLGYAERWMATGLRDATDLNEKECRVVGRGEGGRVLVDFGPRVGRRLLRPANLRVLRLDGEWVPSPGA